MTMLLQASTEKHCLYPYPYPYPYPYSYSYPYH
jgi:hypothetical protein